MHWGRSNHHAEYQMNNQKLEVTAEKGLGIIISQDLKASPQCIRCIIRLVTFWDY